MGEKTYVSELTENQPVRSVFLVAGKTTGTTKYDDLYVSVDLVDKTGKVSGKIWDDAEALASRFEADDFVVVEGMVDSYKGAPQIRIRDVQRVEAADIDMADFVPASRWDRSQMLAQLQELIERELESPSMLRFFDALFDETQLMEQFAAAPAAKGNHHAYLGGLLEHALSMTRIGADLCRHYAHYYPGLINQDLVIAGCVLHDIGKCFELSYGRSFDYTDEGKLVGHIVQGVELITSIAQKVSPPLPANMLMQLKHLILSHHGRLDYGSPVRPKMPEALLLHEIDMIDSRMNMCARIAEEHEQGVNADQAWTDYQRLFKESLYMGDDASSTWTKVTAPADDLQGPGAVPQRDVAAATSSADRRKTEEAGESEANLDLFPD